MIDPSRRCCVDSNEASSPGTLNTSKVGSYSSTVTATSKDGQTATSTIHYSVQYQILAFFSPSPGSKWKLGQTVPVKLALAGASGARMSDAAAAALAAACQVKFSSSGAQSLAGQCMKYDSGGHQFIYNWGLAKSGTGADTITVTVTYPGTTTTTSKSVAIIISG